MGRTYRRDASGRFSGGGGGTPRQKASALQRRTLPDRRPASRQPAFRGQLLQAGPNRGTARPRGTIAGTAEGRQRAAFGREMAAAGMTGRGVRRVTRQAPNRLRAQTGDWGRSSAPRGTISGSNARRREEADWRASYGAETRGARKALRSSRRQVLPVTRASRRRG